MYRSIEIWNSYQIRIPSIKSLFSGAIVLVSCCKWVESQVKPLEHCGTENTDTHKKYIVVLSTFTFVCTLNKNFYASIYRSSFILFDKII